MSTPIGMSGLSRISAAAAPSIVAGSASKVALFDDFLGDVVADQWNYTEGTDTTTANGAILSGGIGGVFRLTTGDAGTGQAADLAQLANELQWQASNGGLEMSARVKLSALTDAYVFVGFSDVGTLEAPIESAASANTLTSNASNAVGFMFDSRMTTDNFWLVGVKADVDATHQDSTVAPAANEYVTLGVSVTGTGEATFFINGVQVGTTMSAAITAATDLTPVIACGNTANTTSKTLDVDYVAVSMNRGPAGAAY